MEDPNSRDVIIQQKLYRVNMANDDTATRTTVRVKEYSVKNIIDIEANVFIITYLIIKRFQLTMGPADSSQIIAVD